MDRKKKLKISLAMGMPKKAKSAASEFKQKAKSPELSAVKGVKMSTSDKPLDSAKTYKASPLYGEKGVDYSKSEKENLDQIMKKAKKTSTPLKRKKDSPYMRILKGM